MTPPDPSCLLERFPPALRALVAAELAVGNRIVEIASTFPAPPAGAWLMLERAVSTQPRASGEGVGFFERDHSGHSGEFYDADRFWFVLEPPNPDPPPPDMDAIRTALEEKSGFRPPPVVTEQPVLPSPPELKSAVCPKPPTAGPPTSPHSLFTLEVDYRGDALIYREEDRETHVICGFGGTPCILGRTLANWWYPAEQRSERMSAEEKAVILERIANHCRDHLGMAGIGFEET